MIRWRVIDLCQGLWETFQVRIAKPTLSREVRAFGYRKLSARPVLTSLNDPGPALTPVVATALHEQPKVVAWFAIKAPSGAGVIARAHTEAGDGGRLLPGQFAAGSPDKLQAMMPAGLTFDPA